MPSRHVVYDKSISISRYIYIAVELGQCFLRKNIVHYIDKMLGVAVA
jgi:hypothetical protein